MKQSCYLLLLLLTVFVSCTKTGSPLVETTGEEYFRGIFLLDNEISEELPTLDYFNDLIKAEMAKDEQVAIGFKERNDRTVEAIRTLDKNFFDELAFAIQNKNASLVEEALDKGTSLISIVLIDEHKEQYPSLEDYDFSSIMEKHDLLTTEGRASYLEEAGAVFQKHINQSHKEENYDNGKCLWLWGIYAAAVWDVAAAVNYGVVINLGAAVNVAAYVFAVYRFWPEDEDEEYEDDDDANLEGQFEREKFVAEILNL